MCEKVMFDNVRKENENIWQRCLIKVGKKEEEIELEIRFSIVAWNS